MCEVEKPAFDATAFLASAGPGRRMVTLRGKQILFSQGEAADSVFYLQSGRAKLTVCKNSREATITVLAAGQFLGEESLGSAGALHTATATSITACKALEIDRDEMIRLMREQPTFSERFVAFVLARGVRIESDLVDQLFNSSERRLAKLLLLMADFDERDESERLIPEITEERLAEMIGAPRAAVSFFMNRFRELGLIDYTGGIRVRKALFNVILHDQLPGDNTAKPAIEDLPQRQ